MRLLLGAALGACAATIIVLVAMSRKEPPDAYEEPEDGVQPVDPYLAEFTITGNVNYDADQTGVVRERESYFTWHPLPAGLVRHG